MISEIRLGMWEPYALQVLSVLDMSHATVVMCNWHELVILFNLPQRALSDRLLAAEAYLDEAGIEPSSLRLN